MGNNESVSLTVAAASGTVDRKDKGRKHEINSDKTMSCLIRIGMIAWTI